MAGRKLEYEIGVDATKGISGVKQFSSAVKKELRATEDAFEDTSTAGDKVATVLSKMAGELDDELKRAATAADALRDALGTDLASRADVGAVVGDLQRMGLSFEEIVADADKLGAALKELDQVQTRGLEQGLGGVNTKVGDIGKSADSSKSVLANMIGNASQDLGSLTGLAGSAGVAIGQMGEYMADAIGSGEGFGSVLKSFAAVAGPIAAISAAIGIISNVTAELGQENEAAKRRVDAFTAALEEQGDVVTNLAKAMQESADDMSEVVATSGDFSDIWSEGFGTVARGLPVLGDLVDKGVDVVDLMDALGLSMKDLAAATSGNWEQWRNWRDTIDDAVASGKISQDQAEALDKVLVQQVDALNKSVKARRAMLPLQIDQAQNEARIAAEEENRAKRLDDYNEAQARATEGAAAYSEALQSIDFKDADLAGAVSAMGKFNDKAFALTNMAQDLEESFAALGDTLVEKTEDGEKRIALTGDVATEAGRAQQDAIEGVAQALEVQFAGAYDKADGSLRKFRQSAKQIGDATLAKLQEQLGLTDDEVATLRDELNLTAKDYKARFEMSGTEEALTQIGLLQTAIDDLPEEERIKVTQEILAGDYKGALKIVQDYYDDNPLNVNLNVSPQYPSGFRNIGGGLVPGPRANGGTIPPSGEVALVGERGPEIVALPGRSRVYTAGQTANMLAGGGTTNVFNIALHAGVIGAPWDVARAVEDANRRLVRLFPRNP
jgi:polyhydroxyalkanoate synthesis regulator phasin